MALTKQQFIALRQKGLNIQDIIAFEKGQTPQDIRQQEQLKGNQFDISEEEATSGLSGIGKGVLKVTGGERLATGLGQALAAPEVQRTLSQEQAETSEMQQKLLTRIREKKELGEDTSRLEKALKKSQELQTFLADAQQDFGESLVTGKEIAGSALRLATLAGGGTIGRFASKALALGKATTFAGGALRGAGVGATTGGVFGGVTGAGVALEQDKDLQETLKSAATGAVLGVILGAPLGAVTGGFSGVIQGRRVTRANFEEELVSPKLTPKVGTEAIEQGRLRDPGFFRKASIEAGPRDKTLANAVKGIVKPEFKVSENINAMKKEIGNIATNVENVIRKNKVPFNTNQLKTQLIKGKDDLRLVFASDRTAERTYDAVVKEFMRNVGKKDTLGLHKARVEFDQVPAIKKLLESQALGENARREIVLQVRRRANEYVASLLPKGNKHKTNLLKEHYIFEALGNFSTKSQAILGKNQLQILSEQFPMIKWILGAAATGAAAALGFRGLAGGVGAGGTIVGSSD